MTPPTHTYTKMVVGSQLKTKHTIHTFVTVGRCPLIYISANTLLSESTSHPLPLEHTSSHSLNECVQCGRLL